MAEQTTVYAPQRRYHKKQQDLGRVKVSAWVPEEMRDRALNYMAKLRREHEAAQQK